MSSYSNKKANKNLLSGWELHMFGSPADFEKEQKEVIKKMDKATSAEEKAQIWKAWEKRVNGFKKNMRTLFIGAPAAVVIFVAALGLGATNAEPIATERAKIVKKLSDSFNNMIDKAKTVQFMNQK